MTTSANWRDEAACPYAGNWTYWLGCSGQEHFGTGTDSLIPNT